jgi:hypothetical protein
MMPVELDDLLVVIFAIIQQLALYGNTHTPHGHTSQDSQPIDHLPDNGACLLQIGDRDPNYCIASKLAPSIVIYVVEI